MGKHGSTPEVFQRINTSILGDMKVIIFDDVFVASENEYDKILSEVFKRALENSVHSNIDKNTVLCQLFSLLGSQQLHAAHQGLDKVKHLARTRP